MTNKEKRKKFDLRVIKSQCSARAHVIGKRFNLKIIVGAYSCEKMCSQSQKLVCHAHNAARFRCTKLQVICKALVGGMTLLISFARRR